MSMASGLPNNLDKAPYEETHDVAVKYDLGGAEGAGFDVSNADRSYTRNDQMDMQRMGKNQELMRMFRSFSTFSFTIMLQATWEIVLVANSQGLRNGGMAGSIWSYIWTYAAFITIVLSMAEMASMAPTSGGQYHWVSEFAPPRYQKTLSYVTGWMSTMSWQGAVASGSFLIGTISQGLIAVNRPSYEPQGWQGTLFIVAVALLVMNINLWAAKALPFLQNVLLVLHVFAFTAIVIILWVVARVQPAKTVFTQFANYGGWNSMGLTLMVGQVNAVFAAICSDAAAHMSEEVKDAGLVVPRAMVTSFVINGSMGLIMMVTLMFCMPNVLSALEDSTTYPFLYVLRSSMSTGAVNGITLVVLLLITAGSIDGMASASRQAWALARDRGLPFSQWIAHVHPRLHIPANAIALTFGITVLLSLINIGSTTAFSAIISLQLSSLMFTYMMSIACVFYRRLTSPELLPEARWSLGRFGPMINGMALVYSTYAFFWCFWPILTPVDATTFNWAVLMFMTLLIASGMTYLFGGRQKYVGPVALVKNERMFVMT